jgi:hypothetical protein
MTSVAINFGDGDGRMSSMKARPRVYHAQNIGMIATPEKKR